MIEMRPCSQCGATLSLSEFYIDRGKPTAACKACKRLATDKDSRRLLREQREARDAQWFADYPRLWHMLVWNGVWDKDERWRPIPRYVGLYEASDWGRVRSLWFINGTTRQLRQCPLILVAHVRQDGRPTVSLVPTANTHVTEAVYRLVLEAFVGPCPDGFVCAHYDGNAANNTLQNLRWATYKENEADKVRHGRAPIGERNPAAKLTLAAVQELRAERESTGLSFAALGRKFGISDAHAQRIVTHRSWRISEE